MSKEALGAGAESARSPRSLGNGEVTNESRVFRDSVSPSVTAGLRPYLTPLLGCTTSVPTAHPSRASSQMGKDKSSPHTHTVSHTEELSRIPHSKYIPYRQAPGQLCPVPAVSYAHGPLQPHTPGLGTLTLRCCWPQCNHACLKELVALMAGPRHVQVSGQKPPLGGEATREESRQGRRCAGPSPPYSWIPESGRGPLLVAASAARGWRPKETPFAPAPPPSGG